MKFEIKFSISLRRENREEEKEEQFEHRDTEAYIEPAGPQRVGFEVPVPDREE